ncbi:MAG: hypothetical protein AB1894_24025 [Chloroflexota bacterium]
MDDRRFMLILGFFGVLILGLVGVIFIARQTLGPALPTQEPSNLAWLSYQATQIGALAQENAYQATRLAQLSTQQVSQAEFLSYEATLNAAQATQLAGLGAPPATPIAWQALTPSPMPSLTPFPSPTPAFPAGVDLLVNGSLDAGDFGKIRNWAQTDVATYRWYLVQDVPPGGGREDTRWIERVDLSEFGRGFGLLSTDFRDCNSFCSVSAVQHVPALEGLKYRLSADFRTEKGGQPSLYMDFLSNSRVRIQPVYTFFKDGSPEWTTVTVEGVSPPGTRFIRVILYSGNHEQGVIYWDNVSLVILGE